MNKELIEKIIAYNYNEYGAEFGDALVDLKHESEWLHHIIKEVRKYIENYPTLRYSSMDNSNGNRLTGKLVPTDKILEILDEENI